MNVWFILSDKNGNCKNCHKPADKHDAKEKAECYRQWHFLHSKESLETDIDY